jgi:hypothetical protein
MTLFVCSTLDCGMDAIAIIYTGTSVIDTINYADALLMINVMILILILIVRFCDGLRHGLFLTVDYMDSTCTVMDTLLMCVEGSQKSTDLTFQVCCVEINPSAYLKERQHAHNLFIH